MGTIVTYIADHPDSQFIIISIVVSFILIWFYDNRIAKPRFKKRAERDNELRNEIDALKNDVHEIKLLVVELKTIMNERK